MEKEFAVPVAAFVAAAASVAVGHPFDTIKTRMQTKKNSSLLNSIKEIHRNGGIPSFYAGVAPVLISVSVLRALSFSIYSHSSKLYSPNDLQSLIIVSAFSGAVTGTLVSTLNAPFEFIKVQRQLFTSTSTSDLLKHTFKTKGPMFLYTAAHLHILRDSLGTALYFSVYEASKYITTPKQQKSTPLVHAFSGGMAGILCWLVLFPIDVVKSVIQKESMRLPEPRFKKGWDFVKYAYKRDGLKRFYNGITPQLIRAFPVHALSFVIFEDVLKRLQL